MRFNIIAVGKKMPAWVEGAFDLYLKRFPQDIQINLKTIDSNHPKKTNPDVIKRMEGDKMLALLPAKKGIIIALDEHGKQYRTQKLAEHFTHWQLKTNTVNFLIGGAQGLDPRCLEIATQKWSLSDLTLPHGLVRVVLIEQLYRAWTLLNNHPYHRE